MINGVWGLETSGKRFRLEGFRHKGAGFEGTAHMKSVQFKGSRFNLRV